MKATNQIVCECGYVVFSGEILKSRILIFQENKCIAKCKRCRRDVVIPQIKLLEDQMIVDTK